MQRHRIEEALCETTLRTACAMCGRIIQLHRSPAPTMADRNALREELGTPRTPHLTIRDHIEKEVVNLGAVALRFRRLKDERSSKLHFRMQHVEYAVNKLQVGRREGELERSVATLNETEIDSYILPELHTVCGSLRLFHQKFVHRAVAVLHEHWSEVLVGHRYRAVVGYLSFWDVRTDEVLLSFVGDSARQAR